MAGDLTGARRWAGLALRRFRARGNHAWAALAELTRLRAASSASAVPRRGAAGAAGAVAGRPGARRGLGRIGVEAEELAGRLRAHGLPKDAEQAELLAARAFTVARRRDDAVRCLAAADGRGRPLEVVLLRRLARAELAAADGRTGAALAELRAGLATLHDPSRSARQPRPADRDGGTRAPSWPGIGLRLALRRGTPRHVFSWLERSRAQSFRVHPVRPPADPEAAAVLAELRQLGFLIRTAELSGDQPDPAHLASRAELQRQVRQRSWRADGLGQVIALAGVAAVAARAGRERPGARQHRRSRPAPARGHDRRRRAGAADQAGRLRRGRRGGAAADRRPGRAGRAAAPAPAGGGHQGVGATPDPRARARRWWRRYCPRSTGKASSSSRSGRWPAFPGECCRGCGVAR